MNKERRKTLVEAYNLIDRGRDLIEQMAGEEREAFENLSENLQNGERGQRMSEVADTLDEAASELQDILDKVDEATQ